MPVPYDIDRQEYNDITMARELSYQVGILLKGSLGKMNIYTKNYYPEGSVVSVGGHYSVTFTVTNVSTNEFESITVEYTATEGDSVSTVLNALSEALTQRDAHLIGKVYDDYTDPEQMHMFFIPEDGYKAVEDANEGMASDEDKVWTESDTPACYVGYGKFPAATYPRIIITPEPVNTICAKMESNTLYDDEGNPQEYTSSYIQYGMTLTCEAGDSEQVLETGVSASSILNKLKRMLVNDIVRITLENNMNSVVHPIQQIIPQPAIAFTQYMSIAQCSLTFDCVDVYYPEDPAGFFEEVVISSAKFEDASGNVISDGEWVIDRDDPVEEETT